MLLLCLPLTAKAEEKRQEKEILIMPVKSQDAISSGYAKLATKIASAVVASFDEYHSITMDEVKELLTLEQQKQLLGCENINCYTNIAGLLGADLVLTGSVSKEGDVISLIFTLLEPKSGKSVERVAVLVRNKERFSEFTKKILLKLFKKRYSGWIRFKNLIEERRLNGIDLTAGLNIPQKGLKKGILLSLSYVHSYRRFRFYLSSGLNSAYVDLKTATNPTEETRTYTGSLSSLYLLFYTDYMVFQLADIIDFAAGVGLGYLFTTGLTIKVDEEIKKRLPELIDGTSFFYKIGINVSFYPLSRFVPQLKFAYRMGGKVLIEEKHFNPFGGPVYEKRELFPVGLYLAAGVRYRF